MIGEERPIGIKLTNPGSVDWYYGGGKVAYDSLDEALNAVPQSLRLGKTIGVFTEGKIVEYWFASGTTNNDLVLKGSDIDLSGYLTEAVADSTYQVKGQYLTGITSNAVTNALGYVPLSGYTIDFSDYYNKSSSDSRYQVKGDYVSASTITNYQNITEKNEANGYAGLNSAGLLPLNLFPDRLLGNVKYKGTYNGVIVASADPFLNGLALPTSNTAVTGYYFISTSDYTYSGVNYKTGDWIISNGSAGWSKVENSDAVSTVFGRNGNVVANAGDYAAFYPSLSATYANPSFVSSLTWSKITGSPTTLFEYGITSGDTLFNSKYEPTLTHRNQQIYFGDNANAVQHSGLTYDPATGKLTVSSTMVSPVYASSAALTFNTLNGNGQVWQVGGVEKMRMSSLGAFIINSTTDNGTDKLQVNGSASFTGSGSFNSNLSAGGNLTVTGTGYIGSRASIGGGNLGVSMLNIGNGGTTPFSFNQDFTASGWGLRVLGNTYNSTSTGTTATHAVGVSFAAPTFTSDSPTTVNNLSTVFINGNPTAGSGVTATNVWGLLVNGANTFLNGAVSVGGSIAPTASNTYTMGTATGVWSSVFTREINNVGSSTNLNFRLNAVDVGRWFTATGNLGVGTTTDDNANKLQVAGSAKITRTVFDGLPALTVSNSGSSYIQAWQQGNTTVAGINSIGNAYVNGVSNLTSTNNSYIALNNGGANISRNIADGNAALVVSQNNTGSTGNIQTWQFGGIEKAKVNSSGVFYGLAFSNINTFNNSAITLQDNSTVISRNIADANPALIVNNILGSGDILRVQQNGSTKVSIDSNGALTANSIKLGSGTTANPSSSNAVSTKIPITVNGTTYYLLASTSAT